MGAVAAMTSPLVSAHAAIHGVVSPAKVSPTGTTTLYAAPAAARFAPRAQAGTLPAPDSFFLFKPDVGPDPTQVNDSLFSFPSIASTAVSTAPNSNFSGFDGLSHYDQAFSGTGVYYHTQFSEEPPDQALAVGNGYVVEAVNNAIAVYKTDGTVASAPVPMYQFLGLPPEISSNGNFGAVSLSDPRAYYDPVAKRFFIEEWGTGQDVNGNGTGSSAIYVAVSKTSDPTGPYTLYTFDTTFDPTLGNNPLTNQPIHILPDYVQIGADANGFYMSINQFDLSNDPKTSQGFVGQRILAVSKADLVKGSATPVVSFSGGDLYNSSAGFTVQPAKTPAGGTYDSHANGTEYFLSSNVFNSTANQLGVWAISDTASIDAAAPGLTLSDVLITSLPYTYPTASIQPPGPLPLAAYIASQTKKTPPENRLDSGDTRMTRVTYVMGHLYSAVETSFPGGTSGTNSGITYFSVVPTVDGSGAISARLERQGFARVQGETLSYPTFGINSKGGAVITCALIGPDFYPSAAYVPLDSHLKAGTVQVTSLGVAPADGFTGYAAFGGRGVERWGDYSEAQADENGNMWLAQETISAHGLSPRSFYANYGTFISQVKPTSTFGYK